MDAVLYKKLHHLGYQPMTSMNYISSAGGIGGVGRHRQGFEQRLNNKLLDALMIDKVGTHGNSWTNMDEINPDAPFNERLTARLMDIVLARKFGHHHQHGDNPAQDPDSHIGMNARMGLKREK